MNDFKAIMKKITTAHSEKKPFKHFHSELMDWFEAGKEIDIPKPKRCSKAVYHQRLKYNKRKTYKWAINL